MRVRPSVLFVGHGSPLMAAVPGEAGTALMQFGRGLGEPRAVLVISPHWETQEPTVSTAAALETMHDFNGFPAELDAIHYPASGSAEAAREVTEALAAAGLTAATHPSRGLDHGAWVPLRYLLPAAAVPIVPLSIQHHGGPHHAYRVGQALAPLRQRGWLIVGSGNITHNLGDWQQAKLGAAVDTAYAQRFADWIYAAIAAGQVEPLLRYRDHHPDGMRAHPRDEHLLPLFTALGAAGPGGPARAVHRGIRDHVIAMDSYVLAEESETATSALSGSAGNSSRS